MRDGAIGKALHRFEEEQTRKGDARAAADDAQLSLFGDLPPLRRKGSPTPICDRIAELIARPDIQRLDERRYAEARKIQRRHDRVVFLAERIAKLELFAANLAQGREEEGDHVQYVATSDVGQAGETRRRARQDIVGPGPAGFTSCCSG